MEYFSDKLNKCVICGSQPTGALWFGTETTHSGDASITCSCGIKMELEPYDIDSPGRIYKGRDGWEIRANLLFECRGTLISRWNAWNKG